MDLVSAFKNDVDALIEKGHDCEGVIFEDCWEVNRLCYSLENILKDGLLAKFFGSSSPWDYMSMLADFFPNARELLNAVKDTSKTSYGRSRQFVRMCLNENKLSEYLGHLLNNKTIARKY